MTGYGIPTLGSADQRPSVQTQRSPSRTNQSALVTTDALSGSCVIPDGSGELFSLDRLFHRRRTNHVRHPALAAACSASIQQLIALGDRTGRSVMRLGRDRDPEELEHKRKFKRTRHARYQGFDLYASPPVPPRDRKRLERMLRYMLRPPIAQGRLHEMADGKIALELKAPWDDGTCAIVFEPLELLVLLRHRRRSSRRSPRRRTNDKRLMVLS